METIPLVELGNAGRVVLGALLLFWVGMLGLLWRRSLIGMLVGLLFAWIAVAVLATGFTLLRGASGVGLGGSLVLSVMTIGGLHVVIGLGIVVARIKRRGTLDADDAGLLEG